VNDRTRRAVIETAILVGLAIVIAVVLRAFVAQAFRIPSASMEPQLQVGDRVVVSRLAYDLHEPRRGDVVVFDCPPATGCDDRADDVLPVRMIKTVAEALLLRQPEVEEFIKRVIGLPGETVEVRAKKVHINGSPLDEPYAHYLQPGGPSHFAETTSADLRENYGPVLVPPDQYFVMGDNRDNSQDSRYWGFLPRGYIKGKALMIYWSYDTEGGGNFLTRTRWGRILHQIE
jgi:signal peptidase I